MGKIEEAAVAYGKTPAAIIPFPMTTQRQGKVHPLYMWATVEKIDAVKTGISKVQLESLKEQTDLDYDTLARILAVTKATLHNKKGVAKFDISVSERIVQMADLYSFGYEIFEGKERFNTWMKTPNRVLGGVAPIAMMDTLYGMQEVKNIIGRIAYGVYS